MKSLRLLLTVSLAFATANTWAADKKTAAKKSPSPAAKSSPSPSPSPSATPDQSGLPDPVAEVEGTKIKKAELEAEFANALRAVKRPMDTLTPDEIQAGYRDVLDNMIVDRLLRKRSADIKISDDEVNKSIDQLKKQFPSEDEFNAALKRVGQTLDKVKSNIRVSLQQQKWIESQIADKIKVSDADAKAFYDKNPEQFDMIRASHILILVAPDAKPEDAAAKEKLAKDTKARITKGEDFAKVAGEVSEDPGSKVKGGDLDFFPHGAMVPEFEEAAFKLKVGEVSDPVRSKYGWHIIKLTDKKTITFDEAKTKISDYLSEGKKRAAVDELITNLRDKSGAKIFLPPLPAKTPAPSDAMVPMDGPGGQPAPADQPAGTPAPTPAPAPAAGPGMP